MITNWNLEWANHNSQRNYPLADTATGLSSNELFKIPDSFLIELDLPVHAGLTADPSRFFIKSLSVFATTYSLVVGYQPTVGAAVNVATASIVEAVHEKNTRYALGGVGEYADCVGKVVIGSLAEIKKQPAGIWSFDFEATRLDPDAIRPIVRGVSSLTLVNGNQSSKKLYGNIVLRALDNTRLVTSTSGDEQYVDISFLEGEGSVETCVCEGESAPSQPILTINNKAAVNRNFVIEGSDCISITPFDGGIKILNTCAAPCCGCPDLEVITEDLERLRIEAATVKSVSDRLATNSEMMASVVLSSRLNDRSCVQCE